MPIFERGERFLNYNINLLIIIMIFLTAGILLIKYFFRHSKESINEEAKQFSLKILISEVSDEINKILNFNVEELKLNEIETGKRIRQKSMLREAVRNCCLGDSGKREYVKEYIRSILQEELHVNEGNIDLILPFWEPDKLQVSTQFLILYHLKSGKYGNNTFGYLCSNEWDLEKEKEDGIHYEITEDDIHISFQKYYRNLSYYEKMEILTQIIYQDLYGLDVLDVLSSDESIDNLSCGVGGITEADYNYLEEMIKEGQTKNNCYDNIFVMYRGKQIRLSYLSLETKERLIRVVKNIYRYDAPYMLTAQNGFVVASRYDNTRVTVARPPVSASWAFFLRKFKSVKFDLDTLISGGMKEIAISMIKWIVKANETFAISGSPAAGKTTMLKAIVPYIDPRLSIRMAESVFETMFHVLLPDRNIQVMQERGKVKIVDIINAFKKMDTDITVLGEITEPEMAGAFIQISQSGGKMTMCTLHHETTEKLIEYMRNALMVHYNFKDAHIAEQQVVSAINFDIHMAKDTSGYRYIERITEIVPKEKPEYIRGSNTSEAVRNYFEYIAEAARWKPYYTNDIIVYDTINNKYYLKNSISNKGLMRIKKKLSEDDFHKFELLFTGTI